MSLKQGGVLEYPVVDLTQWVLQSPARGPIRLPCKQLTPKAATVIALRGTLILWDPITQSNYPFIKLDKQD